MTVGGSTVRTVFEPEQGYPIVNDRGFQRIL